MPKLKVLKLGEGVCEGVPSRNVEDSAFTLSGRK